MTSDGIRPPWEFESPVCAEVGTEIFFSTDADEGGNSALVQETYRDAKRICAGCEHITECAEWGIKNEVHGVWGGLTPSDRKRLRNRLGIRTSRRVQLPLYVKR